MLRLAGPVIVADIGWMVMGLVDTLMLGRVSAEALGAVSIGNSIFWVIGIVGIGMLMGLDFLVARAYGAGDMPACHRALIQGLWLSIFLTFPLTAVVYLLIFLLPRMGIQPILIPEAAGYLKIVSGSLLPLLLGTTLRRYLQACNIVMPLVLALIAANLVNGLANYSLVFGNWGFPALGGLGAAYATLFSMSMVFLCLLLSVFYLYRRDGYRLRQTNWRLDLPVLRELLALGVPASIHLLFEAGVFAAASILAGWLTATALAAHHIALKIASFTFMVPLGISTAGAVRVGHAFGRRDPASIARSGWTAIAMGAAFMACSAVMLMAFPELLMYGFTNDKEIVQAGVPVLFVAALFQLFDGIQVVTAGTLRGTGDTKTAMILNLLGHWGLGLPIGYYLCFRLEYGVVGLWIGLFLGLSTVAVALLFFWWQRLRKITRLDAFHANSPGGIPAPANESRAATTA